MKYLSFFKKHWVQLITGCIALFLLPYAAPLIQAGSSEAHTWGFWPSRLLFCFVSGAVVLLTALWIRKKAFRVGAAVLVWAALELLIMFEAFMLCFVGHSFDQSFLLHFNTDAISGEVMKVFWKPVAVVLLTYCAAAAGIGFLAARIYPWGFKAKELPAMLIALALFFVPQTPLAVLTGVLFENFQASRNVNAAEDALNSITATPGKNLVLIVVESLEQNYLSQKHFPGLLPNISKWLKSDNALVFENMVSASTNTFDFLYQSHMGNYMYSISDSERADKYISLSRILKKAGYNTSFLKACTLDFASTGAFVEKVQYDRRMDWQTPEIKAQATELGEWGFRDYDLFKMAQGEFQKLAARNKPFCFTLFTVDSHAPNGVIGKKSLSYTMPGGEKFPLLSALHTTDAALGKFLEFIQKSPAGKDTVVVVVGDHLVMKAMVPMGKSVQAILEYKKRENLLAFILNGKERGKVSQKSWPVDLAPVILHQLGVTHNAVFPVGVNILQEKNAASRKKLSYAQYMALNNKKLQKNQKKSDIFNVPIRLTGDEKKLEMLVNGQKIKCDPVVEMVGFFMEFHGKYGMATPYKCYLDRDFLKLFRTNLVDRNLFYMLCAHKKSLLHFTLGEENYEKYLLACIRGGWYRYSAADQFSKLQLTDLNTPIPRIAGARFDVSKNIVTLKKDGWTLPLFSKNNTYFQQSAIAAADDINGNETVMRKYFHDKHEMKDLYDLLKEKDKMTLIVSPDSEFHKKYNVQEKKMDHILRLHLTPDGLRTELVSMRLPGEMYISKNESGKPVFRKEGSNDFSVRLNGPAPAANFDAGWCYAAALDEKTGKIISEKSFKESRAAAEMMLKRNSGQQTLLICGKNSEFLKKYYPSLAEKNVLFSITATRIRHSVQYSNGNFRIPEAREPLDVLGGASAIWADDLLVVSWGNASFVIPGAQWDKLRASGKELAVKLMQHDPGNFVFFSVTDPAWLTDISKGWKTDFMLLGTGKSRLFSLLDQPGKKQFFVALSRGLGWEFFHSSKVDFSIKPAIFKFLK